MSKVKMLVLMCVLVVSSTSFCLDRISFGKEDYRYNTIKVSFDDIREFDEIDDSMKEDMLKLYWLHQYKLNDIHHEGKRAKMLDYLIRNGKDGVENVKRACNLWIIEQRINGCDIREVEENRIMSNYDIFILNRIKDPFKYISKVS